MRGLNLNLDDELSRLALQVSGPVGVAVSGGGDSRALLELTCDWAKRSGRDVFALTVDHGLRPEAIAEARQVAARCDELGIAHEILTWVPEQKEIGQARSRRARHALLAKAVTARGGSLLLMGHTFDDQLETMIMRRGGASAKDGVDAHEPGLAGMRALSVSPVWPQGCNVFIGRPALHTRRAALRDYLRARALTWIEDPSNQDEKYERVRVRRDLAGQDIAALGKDLAAASAQRFTRELAIADWMEAHVHAGDEGLIQVDIENLPSRDILSDALAWLLMAAAGTDKRARKGPRDRLTDAIIAAPRNFQTRTLGGAVIAPRQGKIHIARDPGRVPSQLETPSPGDIWDGRFRFSARLDPCTPAANGSDYCRKSIEIADLSGILPLARDSFPVCNEGRFIVECLVNLRLYAIRKMLCFRFLQDSPCKIT